jgi:hypothetical protein
LKRSVERHSDVKASSDIRANYMYLMDKSQDCDGMVANFNTFVQTKRISVLRNHNNGAAKWIHHEKRFIKKIWRRFEETANKTKRNR